MASFTKEEREKLYSESIGLISTYFQKSSSELKNYNISIDADDIGDNDLSMFTKTLRIIFLISSIDKFKKISQKIKRRPSKNRKKSIKEYDGRIEGVLNVDHYIRNKHIRNNPKKYPCTVYSDNFNLPENVLYSYIVINLYNELINLDIPKNTVQEEMLDDFLNFLHKKKYEPRFKKTITEATKINESNEKDYIINQIIKKINVRFQKNLVFNEGYKQLLDFFDKYNKRDYLFMEDTSKLKLYDDSFDDKLFELWLLDQINKVFLEEFNFQRTSEEISLNSRLKKPIYKFRLPNSKLIKIYFQKSSNLVWGENKNLNKNLDTHWNRLYKKGETRRLQGFLDILITYDDAKNYPPILIDAKNIFSKDSNSVSEKIYKMVGYLDNFREFADKYNGRRGILVFRNKNKKVNKGFDKLYTSKDGATIATYSINPFQDNYKNKLSDLCSYILKEIGYLDGAIKIKNDYELKLGDQNLLNSINQAKLEGNKEKEDRIAVEINNILNQIVSKRFKDNEEIDSYYSALKENYFGKLWNEIPDEAKKYLAIGEFLFNKVELMEYSSAGVMYCKFLEKLSNSMIVEPFFENHLKTLDEKEQSKYNNWNLLYQRNNDSGPASLEIGKIAWELRNVNKEIENKDYRVPQKEFSHYINKLQNIKGDYEINLNKLNFIFDSQRINIYRKRSKRINDLGNMIYSFSKIRNQIAHINNVDYSTLKKCRNKTLGIGREKSIAKEIIQLFTKR